MRYCLLIFLLALCIIGSTSAHEEGPLEGSQAVSVPATGSYYLNVVASGPWKVSIS